MKKLKRLISCIVVLLILYLAVSVGGICKYLNEYGYSISLLPQTLAVHFGISDGFTVYTNPDNDTSIFIGDHYYIYEDLFKKYGYYECERLGLVGLYNKTGDRKDTVDFSICSQNEWCHWFRIYSITDGYKIEDFI